MYFGPGSGTFPPMKLALDRIVDVAIDLGIRAILVTFVWLLVR